MPKIENLNKKSKGQIEKKSVTEKIQEFRLNRLYAKHYVLFDVIHRFPKEEREKLLTEILPAKFSNAFFSALKQVSLLSKERERKRDGRRQLAETLLVSPKEYIPSIGELSEISLSAKELRNEIRVIALRLISLLDGKTGKNSAILGTLISLELTSDDLKALPKSVQRALVPEKLTASEPHLEPGLRWELCATAEPRLSRALDDTAFLIVNDKLLVKFLGRMSALCLTDFRAKDGSFFKKGVWYAAEDLETREKLRDAFDNGQSKINFDKGVWVVIRALGVDFDDEYGYSPKQAEQLLKKATEAADTLPAKFPKKIKDSISNMVTTREEYRELHSERLNEVFEENV
ncbi:hypothetical protein COB18_03115 [Candidatus Kaiserbacteria bacterium]|nr:MAG: hypothetical protein COB18_03115 [Candidatus Kaiserbacteria bacterium]